MKIIDRRAHAGFVVLNYFDDYSIIVEDTDDCVAGYKAAVNARHDMLDLQECIASLVDALKHGFVIENTNPDKNSKFKINGPKPKNIWFTDGGYTTVEWFDGTKTTVKAEDPDTASDFAGFCCAMAKKMYGSNTKLITAFNATKHDNRTHGRYKYDNKPISKELREKLKAVLKKDDKSYLNIKQLKKLVGNDRDGDFGLGFSFNLDLDSGKCTKKPDNSFDIEKSNKE